MRATKELLKTLGFTLHYDKSVCEPSTHMTYLGFCIDSKLMRVTLNEDKVNSIADECVAMLNKKMDTICNISRIIVSNIPSCRLGAPPLPNFGKTKTKALTEHYGNFDAMTSVTGEMKKELQWWVDNLSSQAREILRKNPDLIQMHQVMGGKPCTMKNK